MMSKCNDTISRQAAQPDTHDTNVGDTTQKNVIYSPVQMAMDYAVNATDFSASSDTISRQAAIETTWEEPSFTDPINVLTEVRDKLKALPPVHSDYDCVLKQFGDCTYDTTGCSDCVIKAKIKAALSAQPEIIHCGDCRFKDDGIDEDGIPFLKCLNGRSYGGTRINDFCSWAERRTDG